MIERPDLGVSDTTIYRAVHSGLLDHTLGGHNKMSARLRPQEAPQEGAVSTGGAGPVTHELGERPAIADRRERVGDWESDTVAGRMSGAVGHPGAAGPPGTWWAARPPPNAQWTSQRSLEHALAPHHGAPSPWCGATRST